MNADFEQIAEAIVLAPGLSTALVQRTVHLDRTGIVRGSDGRETFIQPQAITEAFRVFLNTGSKHYEARNEDLRAAAREAFQQVGLPPPKGI